MSRYAPPFSSPEYVKIAGDTLTVGQVIGSNKISTNSTAGIGYHTGGGGTVTQATSKATGVTLNKPCGRITMDAAALAAGDEATFTLTSSTIAVNDLIVVNHTSGGTAGAYLVSVSGVAAGSCQITVSNMSVGALSEAIVIGFFVLKGVAA